jgi:hypothetical protein
VAGDAEQVVKKTHKMVDRLFMSVDKLQPKPLRFRALLTFSGKVDGTPAPLMRRHGLIDGMTKGL